MHKDDLVKDICEALKDAGHIEGYDYDHFESADAIDPPFAIYRRVAPETFAADGKTYYRGSNVDLELYALDPDEMADLMDAAEALLDAAELYYHIAADTVYIDSEQMYETLYEI